MSYFEITTLQNELPKNKLYCHLYLHHTPLGQNKNQLSVSTPNPLFFPFFWRKLFTPNLVNSSGESRETVINDWPMTDRHAPTTKVIARVYGKECWNGSFNIVFEDARFKGSTLQVMGAVVEDSEWAIVGGTGELTLAHGVIYKKFVEQKSDGNIMELDIHAFYAPSENILKEPVALNKELNLHLFMKVTYGGASFNEARIIAPSLGNNFGYTYVCDYPLLDSPSSSRVVAYAQGPAIDCSLQETRTYHSSFNIVFQDDMYKGSTLQVQGLWRNWLPFEWAIVGGTGQFKLAQGSIYGKKQSNNVDVLTDIYELFIYAFYRPIPKPNLAWTL